MDFKNITIILMSMFYIRMGLKHFTNPMYFLPLMPSYIPYHLQLIYISGFFELLFGVLLLFEESRFYASWGLICLLILIVPANIKLAKDVQVQKLFGVSKQFAIIRLWLQIALIMISYWHSLVP